MGRRRTRPKYKCRSRNEDLQFAHQGVLTLVRRHAVVASAQQHQVLQLPVYGKLPGPNAVQPNIVRIVAPLADAHKALCENEGAYIQSLPAE